MTHKPPLIYRDFDTLYLEFPGHVLRFAFTDGGLHKALAHIPNIAKAPGYVPRGGNIADRVLATGKIAKIAPATQRKREAAKFSPEQRNAASEAIRKMKVGQ